jgi:hypothetical protein
MINVRGDCCAATTSNFTVGVTNVSPWTTPPPNNTQGSNVCAYYPGTPGLDSYNNIYCNQTTSAGRYLYIQKLDSAQLTLCEVQVFGTVPVGPNIALRQPTIQSSTAFTGSAYYNSSLGVDGVFGFNGVYPYTCAQTLPDDPSWWAVDLGAVTSVTYVVINVRADCCLGQVANFQVGLTNVSPWTTQPPMVDQGPPCAYQSSALPLGTNTTIYCDSQSSPGRYLFLKRCDQHTLSFCEIQVFSALNGNPACAGVAGCLRQSISQSGCTD